MLILDNTGVEYLDNIGFRRSLLANSPGENRVFIKRNGKHPYCINMRWTTPVGSDIEDDKGRILGKPAIGIFWQTLDDSMHSVKTETSLFLGTIETLDELKILLKQLGIDESK